MFQPSIIHSWIRNSDKNNTGLNRAWLKTCWSKISSTKKYLCAEITLFSFHINWHDFVDFSKIVIIFSISVILSHQWSYEFNKPQWPYHGLSDWGFFLRHFTPRCQWPYPGPWYGHWHLGQKCVWKNMKNPGLWGHGMVTGGRVKNLIEKKWPGLSDSDMVTGGLKPGKMLTKSECIFEKLLPKSPAQSLPKCVEKQSHRHRKIWILHAGKRWSNRSVY